MSEPRTWFSVQMIDQTRVYCSITGTSQEAARHALHDAVDAWVDETLLPALETRQVQGMPQLRIEVRG